MDATVIRPPLSPFQEAGAWRITPPPKALAQQSYGLAAVTLRHVLQRKGRPADVITGSRRL
jgi:hypothetical protein